MQLPLPPKKLFGNTDRKFLNERQEGLQAFINAVLADPLLAFSLPTKRFLDPENYPEDIQGMFVKIQPTIEYFSPGF